MSNTRIAIEVHAGVIPGQAMKEHTKIFVIPSDMWYAQGEWAGKEEEAGNECRRIQEQARDYMTSLWNPKYINWVGCHWIYY